MEFSIKLNMVQDGALYILRGNRLLFLNNIIFLSLQINFVLANSADSDEMLHYLGLHRLQK